MTKVQLDRKAVAELLGISAATVSRMLNDRSNRNRYDFPEPDGRIGRSPWWWSTTIMQWRKKRPGNPATDARMANLKAKAEA
jgi:predicted DNA-binding transcriptional regulator AlpA